MPAPLDARIALLKNKLKVKLEARAHQADQIRKLRSAARRGDSKAGKEFEDHLDKVMIETHRIDTSGSFPHKSPLVISSKPVTAGTIAQHAGAESGRVIHNPSLSTREGGQFKNVHYKDVHPVLQARRADTIERAATAKVGLAVKKHAGMTASERVKKAWITRHKTQQYANPRPAA